jgi:hypothetical protein
VRERAKSPNIDILMHQTCTIIFLNPELACITRLPPQSSISTELKQVTGLTKLRRMTDGNGGHGGLDFRLDRGEETFLLGDLRCNFRELRCPQNRFFMSQDTAYTSSQHTLPTPEVQVQGAAMPTEQVSYESRYCGY